MNDNNLSDINAFLDSVELDPVEESEYESVESAGPLKQPEFMAGKDQSVLIGSQVAGFSADVPQELRPLLTNVFLLAQLVADKKSKEPETLQWYRYYLDTLTSVGWRKISQTDTEQVISGSSVEVHREIIPIITAALGPSVAAASSVVAILKGLDSMDKDMPWITLFNRKSRRANSHPFQFSQTIMEGGMPTVVLIAFDLTASGSITQVLFFKFSSSEATLKHYSERLGAAVEMLKATEPKIRQLVVDHISGNLAALDDLGI